MSGGTLAHYELREPLGEGTEGGCGVVYRAVDVDLDRLVALRLIPPGRCTAVERRRLEREVGLLAALDHPNVAAVYELGETADGGLFLATAFCDGETLARRLERGPLKPAAAADLGAQIAAGLSRAHERGLVHRNLRPTNVILGSDGLARIVDFGFPGYGEATVHEGAGPAAAPPAGVSPEQLRGHPGDARSDLWALGALLYEMVTGRRPSALEPAEPLLAWRPEASPALARIVARALAAEPADRYADAEELRRDLRDVLSSGARPLPAAAGTEPAAAGPPRTVGVYRLGEPIGGGGMGVVYRAADTRLGRTVALKFLPPGLTRDATAKARFLQEARAASALDHPNLCTLYELGEMPDGQLFLAMPCYDGETLRQRLDRGPLPVAAAVDVAVQAARGLAKAHHQGIVHRDVKPANLMLTSDGVVKILDFGVAKLAGAATLTRIGAAVGTPAYMSPEQMKGEEVDARTDLWSLGAVLYEMLAGRRPFTGDHPSVVRAAILDREPPPLSGLRPEVPPELARVVGRLLAKDPDARYPAADELLAALGDPAGAGSASRPAAATAVPTARRAVRWGGALALAAFLAVLLAALGGWALYRRGAARAPAPPAKLVRLTDQEGSELFPAIAPAGDYFVYAKEVAPGNLDLFLQRVGGGNPIDLTRDSPADDTQPAFSPDGTQIAFRSERDGGGIFLMGATGESVRRLTDFGFNPAWSPDGKEIACATSGVTEPQARETDGELWRVEVATGRRRRIARADAVQPSWSPDGRRIAYWGIPPGTSRRVLYSMPAEGGRAVPLTDDDFLNWSPVWAPDGRSLYFASNRGGRMNLWRLPVDPATGAAQGEPTPLTTSSEWNGPLSLARNGHQILYATKNGTSNIERVALDPAGPTVVGTPQPVTQGSHAVSYLRASPDGRWLLFNAAEPDEDLFIVHPDGSGLRQLTRDIAKDRGGSWSPESGRIVFYSDRGGTYGAWSIRPDGSDLQPFKTATRAPIMVPIWSPDGRRLACVVDDRGLALLPVGRPGALPELIQPAGEPEVFPDSWSPDGKLVAGGAGYEEGIFLVSPDSRHHEKVVDRGSAPIWLDGHRLLYLYQGSLRALDLRNGPSRGLLAPPPHSSYRSFDLSPDGRSLYLVRARDEGDVWLLTE